MTKILTNDEINQFKKDGAIFLKGKFDTSWIKKLQKGMSSLPSTLSEERKTNLFLRAKNVEQFTMLRKHKDNLALVVIEPVQSSNPRLDLCK